MIRRFLLRLPFPRVAAPILPLRRPASVTPLLSRSSQPRFFQHLTARLTTPSSPSRPDPPQPPEKETLSQRLKTLIKSYGWYALGVYAVLTVMDFGVAFVGINLIGAEQVSRLVASAKALIGGLLHSTPQEPGWDELEGPGQAGHEGLYAMIVLAYTVHKTLFLPVRVGLTAYFTPRLVGWLSQRGWAGGEGTRRAASAVRERLRRNSRDSD